MKFFQAVKSSGIDFRVWRGRGFAASLLATMIATSPLVHAGGAWNSIGPPGGTVSALLASPLSPATLYAGTPANGVFVSTDAGMQWNVANSGLAGSTSTGRQTLYTVYALASDSRSVYAATATGLYYTGAASGTVPQWIALASPPSATPITLLAFEPATNRLIAASTQTDGVSTPVVFVADLATVPALTWIASPLLPSAGGMAIGAMAVVAGQGLTPATLMVGVGGNLYSASILPASASLALAWVDADPLASLAPGPVTALAYSADFSQAYACSGNAAFYSGIPLDAQSLWLPAFFPVAGGGAFFNCNAFASVPSIVGGAPQVMLGTDQGAFVSVDGVSFLPTGNLGVGPSANAFATATVAGSTTSTLFVGTGFGVAASSLPSPSGSLNWAQSNGPTSVAAGGANQRLNNANIVDTAVLGTTLYGAAVANDYVEVLSSRDGGATWLATNVASALGAGESVIALAADNVHSVLYAATTGGLLAYSPIFSRWVPVAASSITGRARALALGTNTLFAGTDSGLWAVPLTSAPEAVVAVAAGLTTWSVGSLHVSGGNVYAGTIDSSDENFVFTAGEPSAAAGTAVWAQYGATSAGQNRITSLLLVGNNLLAATNGSLILYASPGAAWVSADNADPAQRITDTFGVVNSLYGDGVSVYAATSSNGVFVSPAGTPLSWTPFSGSDVTALPSMEVHTLRANGSILYAATRSGIASFLSVTGGMPPSTPPPTSSSDSGGGAGSPMFSLLLLLGAIAMRASRPRPR